MGPYQTVHSVGFSSSLLNEAIFALPTIREIVTSKLKEIDSKSARNNAMSDLWIDPEKYPAIADAKDVSYCCAKLYLFVIETPLFSRFYLSN